MEKEIERTTLEEHKKANAGNSGNHYYYKQLSYKALRTVDELEAKINLAQDREDVHAQELSKLLFEARELIDMYGDTLAHGIGREDTYVREVRDKIDAYRAGRGWSPHGFGGEAS
jgi:hypothetical protein